MNTPSIQATNTAYPGYGPDFPLYKQQVEAFKKPHGVQIGDKKFSIRMLVSPYNCSVKFCGRLTPHVFLKDGSPLSWVDGPHAKLFETHKKEIIQEFSEWVCDKESFPSLAVNNPFFHSDTGHYRVNTFVYADDISKEKQGVWWANMPTLINELDKFGWSIERTRTYYNCTYNSPASTYRHKESRVYLLTPPGMVSLLGK